MTTRAKRRTRPLADRFFAKVDMSGGPDSDWPWTASLRGRGYGQIRGEDGRLEYAHRVAYKLITGQDVPEGMTIDHRWPTCQDRRCVNVLRCFDVVTHSENTRRGNIARAARKRGGPGGFESPGPGDVGSRGNATPPRVLEKAGHAR